MQKIDKNTEIKYRELIDNAEEIGNLNQPNKELFDSRNPTDVVDYYLEAILSFLHKLSKPYFFKTYQSGDLPYSGGSKSEIYESKAGAVLITLFVISFIKSLFNIDFDLMFATIVLSFITDFILEIIFLNFIFAIGAAIDSFITIKYLQFGWMLVLFYLIS